MRRLRLCGESLTTIDFDPRRGGQAASVSLRDSLRKVRTSLSLKKMAIRAEVSTIISTAIVVQQRRMFDRLALQELPHASTDGQQILGRGVCSTLPSCMTQAGRRVEIAISSITRENGRETPDNVG